jgi:hypothetical protein
MRKNLYAFLMVMLSGLTLASYASDTLQFFPVINKTAYNLKARQWNKGLWEPLSYGLNDRTEIQTYPILFAVMPSLGFKIGYPKLGNAKLRYSTTHSLTYLTPWLKFWQSTGTGGLITPEITIPAQLMIGNGILVSYMINTKHILTTNLNLNFVLGEKINPIYTVDIPLIYPRFAPAFIGPVVSLKSNIQGKLYRRFQYQTSLDFFHINGKESQTFIENKMLFGYAKNDKIKFLGGVILSHGQYPFGNQSNIIPYFNVIFTFGKK